jgi:hypothetical protein
MKAYQTLILVRKPEGKTPLGRLRCRWKENTRMYQGNRFGRCGLDATGSGQEQW